ncbi:Uncharacterised protein [Burkholderia pseudomallei]|nr:Uncharacterised protein [Burkholderia pseudomallei]
MESGDRGDSVIRRRREESAGRRRRARAFAASLVRLRPSRARRGVRQSAAPKTGARCSSAAMRRRLAFPDAFRGFRGKRRAARRARNSSVRRYRAARLPVVANSRRSAMPGALRDPAARNPYVSAAGPAPVAVRPDIAARARRCGAALAPKRRRRPLGAARIRRPRGTGLRRRAVVRRTIGAARTAARAAAASRSRGRSPGRRARRRRTTACDKNGVSSWCSKAVSWKRREPIARPGSTLTRRVPAIVTNPVTVVTARRSRAGHGHCRNSWGLFGDSLSFS